MGDDGQSASLVKFRLLTRTDHLGRLRKTCYYYWYMSERREITDTSLSDDVSDGRFRSTGKVLGLGFEHFQNV